MKNQKTNKQIAYIIEDKHFGKLAIKKSANAWWMDKGKVERLIMAYKIDCQVKECRFLAGITEDQLRYFKEIHPEFSLILEDMRALPTIRARQTIVESLKHDPNLALKYLERKIADEFSPKKEIVYSDKPILIQDVMELNE